MTLQSKSVSSAIARLGLESALQRGIGPHEFQRLTGIAEFDTLQAGGRIPATRHISMLNLLEPKWTSAYTFDDAGTAPPCAPISLLFAIITNAPTLTIALQDYIEFRALLGDVDSVSVQRSGNAFLCDYRLDGAQRSAISAFGNLRAIARLASQYTVDAGATLVLELSGAAFAPPAQLGQLESWTVRCEQPHNRLHFTTAMADLPYHRHNPVSYAILCAQARADLRQLHKGASFTLRVEDRLTDMLRNQDVYAPGKNALDQLCGQLAISRWGLHRRLQKESTNFQSVLSTVRLAEAKRLLSEPHTPIASISDLLGFSSPSAFSRFFTGHSGTSPSRYKSLLGPGP